MKINTLRIENFKGIKSLVLNLNGNNANIYGDNGTGKTTIYDAWLWLLFGKDSNDRKDFEIRPLDADGSPIEGVVSVVEAQLDLEDRTITLRRETREKRGKPKGLDKEVFLGMQTDYFVNSVQVKKGEYDRTINEIADERLFKILANPLYFNEVLSWSERRKMLIDFAMSMTDREIAEADEELSEVADMLEGISAEDLKKDIERRIRELEKESLSIPVRIDEIKRTLDTLKSKGNLNDLSQELERLKNQREKIVSGTKNPYSEKIIELSNRVAKIQTERNEKINELRKGLRTVEEIEMEAEATQDRIAFLERKIEAKRKEWLNVKNEKPNIPNKCPCCGAPLPEEKRQKAVEEFNQKKAEKMEAIEMEGKTYRTELEGLRKKMVSLKNEMIKIKEVEQKIREILSEPIPEEVELRKLKEEMEKQSVKIDTSKLDIKIEELERKIAKIASTTDLEKRMDSLLQEEKAVKVEMAELKDTIELLDRVVAKKIEILEDTINSKFEKVRFKLFKEKTKGIFEETCETTVDGVPYRNLNHGTKVVAGLNIIKTLARKHSLSIPIFIDNRESVTAIPDMDTIQIINLIVKEKSPLKVEVQEEKMTTAKPKTLI